MNALDSDIPWNECPFVPGTLIHPGEYIPVSRNYINPKGVHMFTWDYYILDVYYTHAWDSERCWINTHVGLVFYYNFFLNQMAILRLDKDYDQQSFGHCSMTSRSNTAQRN